ALQCFERASAGARRHVERPAQMFSRVAQADTKPIMRQQRVVERGHEVALLAKGWIGGCSPRRQPLTDLTWQPRLPLRAAADHPGAGAGWLRRGPGAAKP